MIDPKNPYTEAENEEACGKLWSIYIDEAERYDTRMVESWKGDMDGMLIFVRKSASPPSYNLSYFISVWLVFRESDGFPYRELQESPA